MEAMDKYFKITERGSTLFTEFRAGTATFMTLCYILAGAAFSQMPLSSRLFACFRVRTLHDLIDLSPFCSEFSPAQRLGRAVRVLTGAGRRLCLPLLRPGLRRMRGEFSPPTCHGIFAVQDRFWRHGVLTAGCMLCRSQLYHPFSRAS